MSATLTQSYNKLNDYESEETICKRIMEQIGVC